MFPGYSWRELRDGARERKRNGVLCHSAIEIQSAVGCAYDCTYCPYGAFVCARLDVERFADDVAALTLSRPAQTLYKLNNRTDTLALEPQHGLAKALVERFASLDGRYLLLYSKGDAVDHLVDLEHRQKTVASFTLTPAPVAELLEKSAPPPAARLAAIAKLARAGYPIRVRFSPIVPVRGWREAYQELVRALAKVAEPELVTLWTLSMIELDALERIVPLDALDPGALDAMRAGEDATRGQKGAPLPAALRAELYREIATMVREVSPTTRVSLCLETADVWDAAGAVVVPRDRRSFVCNCGPRASPDALVALRTRPSDSV